MLANLEADEIPRSDLHLKVEGQNVKGTAGTLELARQKQDVKAVDDLCDNDSLQEAKKWDLLLKIICVGGYTGAVDTKGLLIRDYMRTRPVLQHSNPVVGVNFLCHGIHRRDISLDKELSVMLQLWEIPEQERFRAMARYYYADAHGALVFWGPKRPSSLQEALACRKDIKETSPAVPVALVTDNTRKEQWIGPGRTFETTEHVDEFCREHDFLAWCELTSRDWDSGEASVLGRAVHEVVAEIFKRGISSPRTSKSWVSRRQSEWPRMFCIKCERE